MSMTDTKALAITKDESTLAAIAATTGDLSLLTNEQRAKLYGAVCKSLGLNPLTQPFGYIKTQNGLKLYALKGGTDQLRDLRGISIGKPDIHIENDSVTVSVSATDRNGRTDYDIGVVSIKGQSGENLSNSIMKAITKAKRRVTLSLVGLGWLDESEVRDAGIPTIQVDTSTGEIHNQPQAATITRAPQQQPPRQITARQQPKEKGPHTPPKNLAFYDPEAETDPEGRKKVLQRFILTLQDAGMADEHRAALTWGAGYHSSAKNVPTQVLNQWINAIKAKPDVWKNRAEELMIDMQAEQARAMAEDMAFEAQREMEEIDDSEDTPDNYYDAEYLEVEE